MLENANTQWEILLEDFVINTFTVLRYTIIYSLILCFDPCLKFSFILPLGTLSSFPLENDSATLRLCLFLIEKNNIYNSVKMESTFLKDARKKKKKKYF